MKYKMKPLEIEAIQFTGLNFKECLEFYPNITLVDNCLQVLTKYGDKLCCIGDYIMKQDEKFDIIREDTLNKHYELLS